VLDTLTEKDYQEALQKWRRRWDRCLHAGGNYFEGDGEFYDFYSVSPEYFGHTLVCGSGQTLRALGGRNFQYFQTVGT
jgi:hypothetical protein